MCIYIDKSFCSLTNPLDVSWRIHFWIRQCIRKGFLARCHVGDIRELYTRIREASSVLAANPEKPITLGCGLGRSTNPNRVARRILSEIVGKRLTFKEVTGKVGQRAA